MRNYLEVCEHNVNLFWNLKGVLKCVNVDMMWNGHCVTSQVLSYPTTKTKSLTLLGSPQVNLTLFNISVPPLGLWCKCSRLREQYFCPVCKYTLKKTFYSASRFHVIHSSLTLRKLCQARKQYVHFRNTKHFLQICFYLLFRQSFMLIIT